MTKQGYRVINWVGRVYYYMVVRRGLDMECWLSEMFRVRAKLCSGYCVLPISGFPFGIQVFKRCTCCTLRLLRRKLISCAGCWWIFLRITLAVMISVCVSRIYVHRDIESRRRGRNISACSMWWMCFTE